MTFLHFSVYNIYDKAIEGARETFQDLVYNFPYELWTKNYELFAWRGK